MASHPSQADTLMFILFIRFSGGAPSLPRLLAAFTQSSLSLLAMYSTFCLHAFKHSHLYGGVRKPGNRRAGESTEVSSALSDVRIQSLRDIIF